MWLAGASIAAIRLAEAQGTKLIAPETPISVDELIRAYRDGRRDFRGVALQKANLAKQILPYIDLRKADLTEANLSQADLHGAQMVDSKMESVNCSGANLREVNLTRAKLQKSNFSHSDLTRAVLLCQLYYFSPPDFSEATLDGADLRDFYVTPASNNDPGISFKRASLIGADLRNVTFRRADFSAADLTAAHLQGGTFESACFDGATLQRLNSGDPSGNVSFLASSMKNVHMTYSNLRGADFSFADLTDSDISVSDVSGANFTKAKLVRVAANIMNIHSANTEGADLTGLRTFGP
jgi:uncharacterized protein YjbI with pentapeptide repeats